jgi:hypothetical protein
MSDTCHICGRCNQCTELIGFKIGKVCEKCYRMERGMDSRWISVNDRLPDKEVYVLVHYVHEEIKPLDVGFYSLQAKMWNVGFMKTGIVTHWMELPQPPATKD